MGICRAYDIRGIYPEELNEDNVHKIGLAFGRFLGGKGRVALGMDSRISSPSLRKSMLGGLTEAGIDVIDIGMVPTPVLYFSVASMKLDGGAMITGSHNPKEYNGIKLCTKDAVCLSYESGIGEIEKMIEGTDLSRDSEGRGKVEKKETLGKYVDFVAGKLKFGKRLKVVIDPGNGVGGKASADIFRRAGCDVVSINEKPDGSFPGHHPDPMVRENLRQLREEVKKNQADLGVAYDGDADRVGFVDEEGEIITNNEAFALMIKNSLEETPGGKVVYEVLASRIIEDSIKSSGGIPVLCRVGHSYIQQKMMEGAVIGGETSGHYYFRENYSYDDGIFGSAKLAEMLSRRKGTVSEMLDSLPEYLASDEKRIHCPDEKKNHVMERLKEKFKGMGRLLTIDGVKVVTDKSWFIVRPSNTQPALVLRWEADNKEEFEKVGSLLEKTVENEIKSIS